MYLSKKYNFKNDITIKKVCDSKMRFYNANSRYPGSTHDATIWKISVILPLVQSIYRENPHRSIFGDYGYGLTPYIIVPYKNPTTQEEITFYRILAKIRCLVERSFGVLKCRCIVLVHFNISIKSRNPI